MEYNLRALEQLSQSEGWLILKGYLEGELAGVLASLSNIQGQTAESALKASVAYSILSNVKDLPETVSKRLIQALAPKIE